MPYDITDTDPRPLGPERASRCCRASAYVVYGKPDGATVNLARLSAAGASSGGELGFHVPAPAAGDQLGMSIIGISDATDSTGTGDDDLLFGTPGANNGAGANSGSTYSVALYYELGAGGSGFPGEATDKACGFPLPDAPTADPGYNPSVGGGKFDSSLFESKFEAIEAAGTSGTVQIEPRLYCLLEGLTGAAATTASPGSSIADPQSSYGDN